MNEAQSTSQPQVLLFPDVTGVRRAHFRSVAQEVQARLGGEAYARVLDLMDEAIRQLALRLRSYYDIGRSASVVLINEDGVVLREWREPDEIPSAAELIRLITGYHELRKQYG